MQVFFKSVSVLTVKIIKTTGGFNIAMGKKNQYSEKAEALAAGSHMGLVSYQLEKMHGNSFEPAFFKSEGEKLPDVEDLSEKLPTLAKNAGIEIFVLSKFNHLDFVVCKSGLELAKYETEYNKDTLKIKKHSFRDSLSPNKFVSDILAEAIDTKMKELKLVKVKR